MQEFKHFINGVYIGSQSGKTFENRSPVDNSLIGLVHEAGREEVDKLGVTRCLNNTKNKKTTIHNLFMLSITLHEPYTR